MSTVRIYDPDTKVISDIPTDELAPGYILCRFEGIEGEVYVDASKLKDAPGYRHAPFTDPDTLAVFKHLPEVFAEVNPMTPEQWADGFRYDTNPDKEIRWWINCAKAFSYFTKGKKMPLDAKTDYYRLCFACGTNGPDAALQTVELRHLSKARARSVIAIWKAGSTA